MKLYIRYSLLIFAAIAVLLLLYVAVANTVMCASTSDRIYIRGQEVGEYDYILVLGAGLREDGRPSDMLAERVDCAAEAYKASASSIVIMSGDKSPDRHYDEPAAMCKYASGSGIPNEALETDGEGYSTFLSMKNLAVRAPGASVLIVTQKYHLTRAVYIAEELGLDAHGLASDSRQYSGRIFRLVREMAARTKDFTVLLFG